MLPAPDCPAVFTGGSLCLSGSTLSVRAVAGAAPKQPKKPKPTVRRHFRWCAPSSLRAGAPTPCPLAAPPRRQDRLSAAALCAFAQPVSPEPMRQGAVHFRSTPRACFFAPIPISVGKVALARGTCFTFVCLSGMQPVTTGRKQCIAPAQSVWSAPGAHAVRAGWLENAEEARPALASAVCRSRCFARQVWQWRAVDVPLPPGPARGRTGCRCGTILPLRAAVHRGPAHNSRHAMTRSTCVRGQCADQRPGHGRLHWTDARPALLRAADRPASGRTAVHSNHVSAATDPVNRSGGSTCPFRQ